MTTPGTGAPRAGTKGVARADREAQIVEVACRCFGETGFAGTNVADVAYEAGISKPLIYNYFGSKEGLYAACLTHAGELIATEIARTAASGTVGIERALVTLEGIFTVLAERRWLWRLFFDPTVPATPELDRAAEDYRRRISELGDQGVSEILARAGNDDPLDRSALNAVWASVFSTLVEWWSEHPAESPRAMTTRCVRLFTAVFGDLGLQTQEPATPAG